MSKTTVSPQTTRLAARVLSITDNGGTLNCGGLRYDDITTANANTTMTINGVISNAVGGSSAATLIKDGPGTVILNAANTFSGTTNIKDGTLVVTGSLAGGITMSTGFTTGVKTTLTGTGVIGGLTMDAAVRSSLREQLPPTARLAR